MARVLEVGPPAGATGRIVLIAAAAAVGGFLFGYDTAVINGAVAALASSFAAGSTGTGLAVSSALLGSAVGAAFAGRLADRSGRLGAMRVAAVLFTLSGVGSALAFSLWDFSLWRLVGGVAVGVASVVAPAYIAEVAPAHLRGRLGSLQQLAIVVGIFLALLADYGLARAAGSAQGTLWLGLPAWRWMFLSEVPPALLYGLGAWLIPESPRYLVARGRGVEALLTLRLIEGAAAESRVEQIRLTLQLEHAPRLSDLRGPALGLLPVVWVGVVLSAFQQLVGINVIFYYSSVLWQAVGFSEQDALAITALTGVTNIVTTLIAIACVDRFGRRPLLLLGSAGMVLALGTLAWTFGSAPVDAAGNPALAGGQGTLALVAANLYVFCFGFSWGPVVWVLLGEMFPNRLRALALSLAASVQWVANFLVSATFPALKEAGLGLAYGLYTGAALLSLLFVLRFVRETKGKHLEEM
ncbi:sugar porter family MFS transporter [Aggregicoccus sp. 17bor-14]|uniref:sugar porter family MFS transporter n=1 Tax=Myxococcaceae TaxID=31 RepID=UPI00129C37AB|nr:MULTISPECIES: sugar porter family MFS transporter [Myxococcaceae]MBF5046261.1 sugar porter family MFS transporter [Simulacricoccus sp. 17bor-14]MRI91983.1 sugar porter family MFS transporter [Aggregicoccus sp. 17bor-14]